MIGLGLVIQPATRWLGVDRRRARVEYPRAESRTAVLAVIGVMVIGVFAFEVITPVDMAPGTAVPPLNVLVALRILVAYAVAGLPVWIVLLRRKDGFATVGFGRQNLGRATLLALSLGLAFALVNVALDPSSVGRMLQSPFLLALAMFLGIGLIEEVIYRGYLQGRLSWAIGPNPALVIASLIMALAPLPHYLVSQDMALVDAARAVGLMLAPSFVLGFFMTRTQNILAPAILHGFIRWSLLLSVT